MNCELIAAMQEHFVIEWHTPCGSFTVEVDTIQYNTIEYNTIQCNTRKSYSAQSYNKISSLRNDLYCVEWDVKFYYTLPTIKTRPTVHYKVSIE